MSYENGGDRASLLTNAPVFSWHAQVLDKLQKSIEKKRLPHALLFVGATGIGKRQFAEKLVNFILCEEQSSPCGGCRQCLLFQAGTHPDFLMIEPEGKMIKIDQVRDFLWQIDKTPQIAKCKIVVIDQADMLNQNASNALLKTLEEPSSNTYFILITNRLNALLATIRSRCQIINFTVPNITASQQWIRAQKECDCYSDEEVASALRVACGAPIQALRLLQDGNFKLRKEIFWDLKDFLQEKQTIVQLSTKWSSKNVKLIIEWLMSFIEDLIRFKQTNNSECFIQIDLKNELVEFAKFYKLPELFQLYDAIIKSRELLLSQVHANEQLLLESLLLIFKKKY